MKFDTLHPHPRWFWMCTFTGGTYASETSILDKASSTYSKSNEQIAGTFAELEVRYPPSNCNSELPVEKSDVAELHFRGLFLHQTHEKLHFCIKTKSFTWKWVTQMWKVHVSIVLTRQKFVHVFFVIPFNLFIPDSEKKLESVPDVQILVLSFESL